MIINIPLHQLAFGLFSESSHGHFRFDLHRWRAIFYKRFQVSSKARASQPNTPLFDICSSLFVHQWEAEESALVRALVYFDEVLGWTIGDRNYLMDASNAVATNL